MIENILKEKRNLINKHLAGLLKTQRPEHKILFDSMNYSLLSNGKRIRGCLFLFILEMFKVDYLQYLDIAASVECVHTYSLIHDDLPCMDNDDYRRGILTNHKKYGEGVALQAGDALLTFAFQLISQAKFSAKDRCKLIEILSIAAGAEGMVAGQVHDIQIENKSIELDELKLLDKFKTGRMIKTPVDMAIQLTHMSISDAEQLRKFAKHLGLLFQITDDILDYKEDNNEIKNTHKNTYVSLLGLEKAKLSAEETAYKAIEALELMQVDSYILTELVLYILNRRT